MTDDEIFKSIEENLNQTDDVEEARKLLAPLVKRNHPGAIRLNASLFSAGMSEEDMDRIYVEGIEKAAGLGDIEARYIIGSWYDIGEHNYGANPIKASQIFAGLAADGHAHSSWIYACDLLWGRGAFPVSVEQGVVQLDIAIERGSAEAAMTKARIHDEGLFGFPQSKNDRDIWRNKAKQIDEDVYDQYDNQLTPNE